MICEEKLRSLLGIKRNGQPCFYDEKEAFLVLEHQVNGFSKVKSVYLWITKGNVGFCSPCKEFHVEWGTTATIPGMQFNVYEFARAVYIKIMGW